MPLTIANVQANDTVDKIIAVVIALFIMSVITEKITTLIRKYPRFTQVIAMFSSAYLTLISVVSIFKAPRIEYAFILLIAVVFLIFSTTASFANTIVPALSKPKNAPKSKKRTGNKLLAVNPLANVAHGNTEASEETKSDEVTLLSFIVGFAVAFAFKADMMAMFKSELGQIDYGIWNVSLLATNYIQFNTDLEFSATMFIGILTSGFFLSFGSKFFHDLIDTLLQTKDLKRKLNNKETFDINKIDDLEEFVSINDIDLAKKAIDENEESLKKKFPNILYISDSMARIAGKHVAVATIYLSDNRVNGLPTALPGTLMSGKTYSIPTEIVSNVGQGKPTSGLVKTVAKKNSPGFEGSACCLLTRDNDTYLLTCCHVLSENDVIETFNESNGNKVICNRKEIGEWVYGCLNETGDFALVKLENASKFISENESFTFSDIWKITPANYSKLRVTIEGSASGTFEDAWVVDSMIKKVAITYNNGNEVTFDEVILVGSSPDKNACSPVTQTHDSGGSVYTTDNKLVGIIAGANNRFSIVIPINTFIMDNNLSLL